MRLARVSLAAAATLVCLAPFAARGQGAGQALSARPVDAGSPASTDELSFEPVSLVELRAHPARWLGRRVRFTLQLARTVERWNPCLSRFGPGEWLALEGWADERFTWQPEVFEDPATRLFVRRGGRLAQVALQTARYSRLVVSGVVREVHLDQPWIEVEGLSALIEEVGEGTILHVGRALELAEDGQYELALTQLERAKAAPLPDHARAEIERLAEECLRVRAEVDARRRAVR